MKGLHMRLVLDVVTQKFVRTRTTEDGMTEPRKPEHERGHKDAHAHIDTEETAGVFSLDV